MDSTFWVMASAGVLMMLSWIGLGWAVHRVLKLNRWVRPHWSIFGASGASLILAVGGVTNLLRITSAGLLNLLTIVGVVFAIMGVIVRIRLRKSPPRKNLLWPLPLFVVGAMIWLSSAGSAQLNPGDDQLAYMVFPQQMLQSGTLIAPFNLRRIGTYGGHQFLQAQLLAATQALGGAPGARFFATHGNLLDTGLCSLLSAGLLWSMMRPRSLTHQVLGTLVVLLFFIMPVPRVNTHAQTSGTFLFLALFSVVKALSRQRASCLRLSIFAGLIAAALATLRMNFAPAAALAIALSSLSFGRVARPLRIQLPRAILPLMVMVAILVPWAMVLMRSSGTPFYPLIKGFQEGAFLEAPIVAHPLAHLGWTLTTVLFPPVLFLLLPFCLMPPSRRLRPLTAMFAATFLTTLATAWACTQMDATLIYRYCAGLLIACAFGGFALLLRRWGTLTFRVRCATLFLLVLVPSVAAHDYSEAFRFSYPALLAPALLLAGLCALLSGAWRGEWVKRHLAKGYGGLVFIVLVVLAVGAVHNFHRVSDNSSIFFYALSSTGAAWWAWSTRRRLLKILWLFFAAATGLTGILALTNVFGITLILCSVVVFLSIGYVAWSSRPQRSRLVKLVAAVGMVPALMIALINLPFFFDNFGTFCLTASIAGTAYIARRTLSPLLRVAAIVALTVLACSAMPSMASIARYPAALPIAWLAIVVLFVLPQGRSQWLSRVGAAVLLVGMAPLALEETNTFIAAAASPLTARRAASDAQMNETYHLAQQSIPPGATIFAIVPEPGRLDFARNPVDSTDFELQFISPPPKLPIHGTEADLRHYWNTQGIRYLMLSYDDMNSQGIYLPMELKKAFMDISQSGRVLFHAPSLTVLDLQD